MLIGYETGSLLSLLQLYGFSQVGFTCWYCMQSDSILCLTVISHLSVVLYRGSFRVVSEVSRNHSGFVPRWWVRPSSAAKFHEAYTQRAEQWCYWLLFWLGAKDSCEDLFFGRHEGKLETLGLVMLQKFVSQRHSKLCTKIPPYTHCKSPQQQAVWKLLIEISRTAPGSVTCTFLGSPFSQQRSIFEWDYIIQVLTEL